MPLASPRPIRSPVNDPGPIDTATPSTAGMASPARPRTPSPRPGSEATCERVAGAASSARTPSPRATPTAAVQVAVSSPRTINRMSRDSALHEPMDVVVEHEHHQAEKQQQPHLLRQLPMPLPQRAAEYALDAEEGQVPAVERRNG